MKTFVAALTASLVTISASASIIMEEYSPGATLPSVLGGYEMTDFKLDLQSGDVNSTFSPIDGAEIFFQDRNGNSINLNQTTAQSTDWWNNGEKEDANIFTTSRHFWIEIILPENTQAFAFNVAANMDTVGWVKAYGSDGTVISDMHMPVGPASTTGYGVYVGEEPKYQSRQDGLATIVQPVDTKDTIATNPLVSISKIVIDPIFTWGFGDLSIYQSEPKTASVPEPSTLAILLLGVSGLFASRRMTK